MRFLAVLNRDGGTLKTLDLDAFVERSGQVFEKAGHDFEAQIVAGAQIVDALEDAAKRQAVDVVVAGGGDGTISAAAAALMNSDRRLAVLPAGTMNLFARSLAIPLSPDAAIDTYANGRPHEVDVATANGRAFIHQFSLGMHPELVERREEARSGYRSRLGKIRASFSAALQTLLDPPRLAVSLDLGGTQLVARTSSLGITNNLFGEGHLPYADMPDGGELGIYLARARRRGDFLRFFAHMARGSWRANPQVEIHRAHKATLTVLSRHDDMRCAIDGELCELERETVLQSHPGALKVLLPAAAPDPRRE